MVMVKGTGKRLVSYPMGAIRQTRGGTPDIKVIARRGEGGVMIPIGAGMWKMMTEEDVKLGLPERRSLVDGRKQYDIEEVEAKEARNAPQIELPEMIDDPRLSFTVMKEVITPASLLDGRARAEELNQQYPDKKKFRVPTEAELLMLNKVVGDQLEGKTLWIWTETRHEDYPGSYVLRHLRNGLRDSHHPGVCYAFNAGRLIRNK